MITVFGRDYHFQKRHWAFIIGLVDTVGALLSSLVGEKRKLGKVKKIILSRIDHLGDVLLATCVLPHIRKAYPEAKIDFMAGEWAKDLLVKNPYVDEVIIYNNFLHNRSGSLWSRIRNDVISFLGALRKIRGEGYDLGIDLRSYFINSIPLLYFSDVKYIVGYGTGGFGFLLDKEVPYRTGIHEVLHIAGLIRSIGIDASDEEMYPSYKISATAEEQAGYILESKGINPKESFILIHPGTADRKKEWNIQGWRAIVKSLKPYGVKIVFCGGPSDVHTIRAILSDKNQDGVIDISGVLPIEAFAGVLKRASLVIGLDSFPCHLASAVGTPTLVLWSGINDPIQWKPLGNNVKIVRRDLPCTPCYKGEGCKEMTCMAIPPGEVMEQVRLQLVQNTG